MSSDSTGIFVEIPPDVLAKIKVWTRMHDRMRATPPSSPEWLRINRVMTNIEASLGIWLAFEWYLKG